MADLTVNGEYLHSLASILRQAADTASSARVSPEELKKELWVSHGVVSMPSNFAFYNVAKARDAAVVAMTAKCLGTADQLVAGANAYDSTDDQTGANLDAQMLEQPAERRR